MVFSLNHVIVYILSTHFHLQCPALEDLFGILVTVLFSVHMTLNGEVCANAVQLNVVGLSVSGESSAGKIQTVQY